MTFANAQIEHVRQYWDRRPCNIRHSPEPVGTTKYFDEVEARKYFVEPHIPGFAQFERWRDKRVLEIGCGIGTDAVNFARHGAQVTAIDISDKSLEIARKRSRLRAVEGRVHFICGNAEELNRYVPLDTYDLIYSFGVLHHTPHPERILGQLRPYSKPGTTLKIMVYHLRSWKVAWILLAEGKGQFWKLQELVARHSEAQTGCPVTYTYTRRQAQKLLESQGFKVSEARVDHIFPYRISEYVRYQYKRTWYFQWMPRPLFQWLEKHYGWHLCMTAQAI